MLIVSYVCLVTLPLISNSTIWFTIGSMEVWLCFDDYIDLTWDLFRQPNFQLVFHPSVTYVSPKCPFCIFTVFQPHFSTEISFRAEFLPAGQVFHPV